MDIYDIAKLFQGIDYKIMTEYIPTTINTHNDIVVAYPYSDDLLEFEGAIYDEFYKNKVFLDQNGIIRRECENEDCPHEEKRLENAPYYISRDCINEKWVCRTNINPHATFCIHENNKAYGSGIVFCINSLS